MCYAVPSASDEDGARQSDLPSPFGGPGGLPGERPPELSSDPTDDELDDYAEWWFNRSLQHFIAQLAASRKARRRRRLNGFTKANCEEASGDRS